MTTDATTPSARWTILGSGTATPTPERGASGHVLTLGTEHVLFDAGAGTLQRLARAGIPLAAIDRVVFTHYHLDHFMELPSLLFALKNPALDRERTLSLAGPPGLRRLTDGLTVLFGDLVRPAATRIVVEEIDVGAVIELTGATVAAGATRHTDESVGYRVTLASGKVLTYSGDTGYAPAVARLARGSDIFVCECALNRATTSDTHLDAVLAGRLAREADARTLVLTHFYPEVELDRVVERAARAFEGEIVVAEDGLVLDLGCEER